jgi:hypothetical protein
MKDKFVVLRKGVESLILELNEANGIYNEVGRFKDIESALRIVESANRTYVKNALNSEYGKIVVGKDIETKLIGLYNQAIRKSYELSRFKTSIGQSNFTYWQTRAATTRDIATILKLNPDDFPEP